MAASQVLRNGRWAGPVSEIVFVGIGGILRSAFLRTKL